MCSFDFRWWLDFGIVATRRSFAVYVGQHFGYLLVRSRTVFSHDTYNLFGDIFQTNWVILLPVLIKLGFMVRFRRKLRPQFSEIVFLLVLKTKYLVRVWNSVAGSYRMYDVFMHLIESLRLCNLCIARTKFSIHTWVLLIPAR